MSCVCAGLPSSFHRFREIWSRDYEFRSDDCHRPVPVAMHAREHRTGTEISLREEQLRTLTQLPFGAGTDSLTTGYAVAAELSCEQMLGLPRPRNVLCTYFETCAALNGQEIVGLEKK